VASGEDCFNEDGSDWTTSASPWALDLTSAPRAELLDNLGIPHEQVNDIGVGYLLEFRDPDNIALELFAPPGDPLRPPPRSSVCRATTGISRAFQAGQTSPRGQLHLVDPLKFSAPSEALRIVPRHLTSAKAAARRSGSARVADRTDCRQP
jgi:hypothetical protein